MLRTEMTVDTAGLDAYLFPSADQVQLTLSCRPLRAILEFSEQHHAPITIAFDKAGVPVSLNLSLTTDGHVHMYASFVLASRAAEEDARKRRAQVQLVQKTPTPSNTNTHHSTYGGSIPRSTQPVISREPVAVQRRHRSMEASEEYVEGTQLQASNGHYGNGEDYVDDEGDFVPGTPEPED